MVAWDLIGYDLPSCRVRIKGGRALYEAVTYYDSTPGTHVKLSRLEPVVGDCGCQMGIRQIDRWVHPDTEVELVPDA